MGGAGLTDGGFYSYFDSKSDLYAEVLGCFFTDPDWKNCWEGVHVDLSSTDVGPQIVRAYLSRAHFEDVENSCPNGGAAHRRAAQRRNPTPPLQHCIQSHANLPSAPSACNP